MGSGGRHRLTEVEAAAARRRLERLTAPTARDRDLVPPGLRLATVSPGRSGAHGLLLLAVAAVIVAAAGLWLARPSEQPVPQRGPLGRPLGQPVPASGGAVPPVAGQASPSAAVFVHVAGAVRRPGLVELVTGSRVADAVAAAGGLTGRADPASVNLARPVVDGEQVVVLRRGRAGGPGPVPSGVAPGGSPGPLDLNTATLGQLDGLPGIGPVLAQRILDWRAQHGRFSSVEELGEVSGIGEATLSDLRPLVTV